MKIAYLPLVCAILAGCETAPSTGTEEALSFVRISDAATFNATVADRRLEWPTNSDIWFTLNSDGSMAGELNRGSVTGSWSFEDGYWCREFVAGGTPSPRDCQTVEVKGAEARFTRNRGAGDAGVYAIK